MVRATTRSSSLIGCLLLVACGNSGGQANPPKDASPAAREDGAHAPKDAAMSPDTRTLDSGRTADTSAVKSDGMPPSDAAVKTDTASVADARPPQSDRGLPPDMASADTRPSDAAKDTLPPRDASGSSKPITFSTWPGGNAVANASVKNAFGTNLSGIIYQPAAGATPAILWAVQNSPSKLFRLTWNGTAFVSTSSEGWDKGKALTFPNNSAGPDAEDLTRTEWDKNEVYVATEKNNDAMSTVRLSILRYELTGTATTLEATHEWNLTADLPKASDANKGLEAIAWIPDSYLVARGFYDEASKSLYDPASYADHGAGIFLVGVEDTGMIYGFVLNHGAGTFKRVATFSSGQEGVMALAFDRETQTLWSLCDSVCQNRMTLFDIDTGEGSANKGRFILRATVPPPSTLTSTNNEGLSMAPESECANGRKSFFWADDDESNGYAIRRDTIPCDRLF